MIILVGTPKEVFNTIYKRYNSNNLIDSEELESIFPNRVQLEEDLIFLKELDLIYNDYSWKYHLTTKGRIYYKDLFFYWFEKLTTSFIFPLIVAFLTALITALLTLLLQNSPQQIPAIVLLFWSIL